MNDLHNSSGIGLAIIWPFAGLIAALRNWRQPWAMNAFWLVCIFMGAIQIYQPDGEVLGSMNDAGRYVLRLEYAHQNIHSFSEVSRYFFDGTTNDVFAETLLFIVSRFTDNGHFFFFVLAIIFGFFYSRNIWYILNRIPYNTCRYFWVLIAAFFLVCPIWEINGVRMFTAAHVFVYGAMPYLLEGKRKNLLWCLSSILIHFSFIYPILCILGYSLLPDSIKQNRAWLSAVFVFYLISLTIKSINLPFLNNVLGSYLPAYYGERIDIYVSDDTKTFINEMNDSSPLYTVLLSKLYYYCSQIMIILSFFAIRNRKKEECSFGNLFFFALFFYSVSNILSYVPSGGRYLVVASMFMFPSVMFALTYLDGENYLSRYYNICALFLGISLLDYLRLAFAYYGYNLIFGNIITTLFIDTNHPISRIIKQFF